MIGDIYNFKEEQANIANQIVLDLVGYQYKHPKFLVGLGGISGTAKSEIAILIRKILKTKYNISCFIIHADDYYKVHYNFRKAHRQKTKIIGKEEMDWKSLNKVFKDFKDNTKKLYVKEIDIFLGRTIYHVLPNRGVINMLLFEGLYACYANVDRKIYLNGTIDSTLTFRQERGKENPANKFRQFVLQREQTSVVQSKKYADFVVSDKK